VLAFTKLAADSLRRQLGGGHTRLVHARRKRGDGPPCSDSNYLAQGSSFGLLMVLFCCVFYKYEALVASEDVKLKMSAQQRNHFSVPSSLLTTVLFLSTISSLVVAGVLIVVQIGLAKEHRESQVAKLQQLAEAPPDAPALPSESADAARVSEERASLSATAAVLAPPPNPAPPPRAAKEVELASTPTAMPVPTSVDVNSDSAEQLPRQRPSQAHRSDDDVGDEMGMFDSRANCDAPPTERPSGQTTAFMVPVATTSAGTAEHPTQDLPDPVASITSAQIV